VDASTVRSDFTDHQGNVHAVVLPAGKYYLAAWMANPYMNPVRIPKAEFSVAPGEMVYLGEYFSSTGSNGAALGIFRDQHERDLKIVAQKNPELARASIVTRIAEFNGWAVGSPESRSAP